jgi:acetyltransferase-like isoleucine patch superfamily enzyme
MVLIKKIIRKILFWARPDDFTKEGIHNTAIVHNSDLSSPSKVNRFCYIYNSKIGSHTYFSSDCTVMNAQIGRYCSIGKNVAIGPGMHPSHTFVSTSPFFWSPARQCGASLVDKHLFKETGNVHIGHDVWIGQNAVIMDNINIGNGAIIAAGAIVTKDVTPYSIVGGVPAKLIKMRFTPEQIIFLENLKWWDKGDAWYKKHLKEMCDIELMMRSKS